MFPLQRKISKLGNFSPPKSRHVSLSSPKTTFPPEENSPLFHRCLLKFSQSDARRGTGGGCDNRT